MLSSRGYRLAILFVFALIAGLPQLLPAQQSESDDWQMIPFENLEGWSEPDDWWRAEDGVIVAESAGGPELPAIHWLIWDGKLDGDCDISLEYRIIAESPQDAGVYFRTQRPTEAELEEIAASGGNLAGFQAELDTGTQHEAAVTEGKRWIRRGKLFGHIHDGKRTKMFQRGNAVSINDQGEEESQPLETKFNPRRVYRNSPEWNECRIEVRGTLVRLYLNGVLANQIEDNAADNSLGGDVIALQFRPRNANRFEVRNLKYRIR